MPSLFRLLSRIHNLSWQCIQLSSVSASTRHCSDIPEPLHDDVVSNLKPFICGKTTSQSAIKSKEFYTYYKSLTPHKRRELLGVLADNYSCDYTSISALIKSFPLNDVSGSWLKAGERLRNELLPLYHKLLVGVGRTEGGVKFLVDMRADVQACIKSEEDDQAPNIDIRTLDRTLHDLLSLWFSVGLLQLERITWQSPCDLIQKISEYEAVHPIRSWADIKQRLGPYRRCFTFTHRCMPREPVVVLHAALTDHISQSIHEIVRYHSVHSHTDSTVQESIADDIEDSSSINTAIFYSISATQKGLAGIDLGHHLIKQTVAELQQEFPKMHHFSSLSPIPGLVDWLLLHINRSISNRDSNDREVLKTQERERISQLLNCQTNECLRELRAHIHNKTWIKHEELKEVLREPFMRLCATYLYSEKRRKYALNPVANFHLSNGAVMWRLNWLADQSQRGLQNSCGMMVNYRYYLENCEANTENYLGNHVIQATNDITDLIHSKGA